MRARIVKEINMLFSCCRICLLLLVFQFFCSLLFSTVPISRALTLNGKEPDLADGMVLKRVFTVHSNGKNLLKPDSWKSWNKGFEKRGDIFICENGEDATVQRGLSQTVVLNQLKPGPIVASAWSRAEKVGGGKNSDYSLYLDLLYIDGTPLWGQVDAFNVGSHDWEKASVVVLPEKPVRAVTFNMLLRRHSGRAFFRSPELHIVKPPAGALMFDGVPVSLVSTARAGFQVRDVAAESGFVRLEHSAFGLNLDCKKQRIKGVDFFDATLSDATGKDRAVTLVYAFKIPAGKAVWLEDARRSMTVEPGREYVNGSGFSAGSNGRLSKYPFAAVVSSGKGFGLGIDMGFPAFFRAGFNSGTNELFLAFDIGLAPEKPSASLRFCRFDFDPRWKFRAALSRFYGIFPEYFRCRTPEQGLWMPFAKISAVDAWQDFGFKFKEGTGETGWDDKHGIITFRYTEPMTWWMRMPKGMPRTPQAALKEARRLAVEKGDVRAKAFLTSGFHDEAGNFPVRLLDTPWCNGAVWSINSMPGIPGDVTDFKNKWNAGLRKKLYGPKSGSDLDGEYIDSSEGYVTDQLDFRRDHLKAAQTVLTYSLKSRKPAVFRGLIAFEYIRALARDIHASNKLMMANATPIRLCWLAPLLDVMGTETNWNPGGKWRPMSDKDLLYRRSLCKGKPYCFLMNTRFELFTHGLVEKYMKRSLAYGMFPGFFSHNASQGHYFSRPKLYNRDRDLFKKYVPLCKLVAEAGWEPVTRALSDNSKVFVERFGVCNSDQPCGKYLTVFNSSIDKQKVTILLEKQFSGSCRDLVHGKNIQWYRGRAAVTLAGEDVMVIQFPKL